MTSHDEYKAYLKSVTGFVARQFGKREITISPFHRACKFYPRCIFTRSTGLLRVRKTDLKAVFDFTYKQLILSSLPIMGLAKKMFYLNRLKVTFKTAFSTLRKLAEQQKLRLLYNI
ncbi:hypothetical protein RclHR1_09220007 [Rhizophagus clarus]|uniref:Uncharacterized protein n=1 Tax=Rhizophagus clarus TaxID=94130 RepID=A0A2Z6S5Z8_9GLOM|nr:hypothetical protein RclHR1_09220007 [Rhizophagus clarus]GES77293.1 hypothetical protein RCL_e27876_RclHR1_09220007 [Rhizophagus clarus]